MTDPPEAYLAQLKAALDALPRESLGRVVEELAALRERCSTAYVLGNGGSYANAAHLVLHLRQADIFAVDLLADLPHLTALSNDVAYGQAPMLRLRQEACAEDLLLVLSGSGASENVLLALGEARRIGMRTAGLLGFGGGRAARLCDVALVLDSRNYGICEDVHSSVIHLLQQLLHGSE